MRALLAGMLPEEMARASGEVCRHIAASRHWPGEAKTIAIYAAHGVEVSLAGLHSLLPDAVLLYPLCRPGSRLSFHRVGRVSELTPGMLGIPEPDPAIHPEVPLSEADVCLCPGLAFGGDGTRLGHGGGYYDRALATYGGLKCGVSFARQLLPSVVHDARDIRMDFLANETGITPARPRPKPQP